MPKRRTARTTRKPAQASHRRFADEYLANGFNATQAYKQNSRHRAHTLGAIWIGQQWATFEESRLVAAMPHQNPVGIPCELFLNQDSTAGGDAVRRFDQMLDSVLSLGYNVALIACASKNRLCLEKGRRAEHRPAHRGRLRCVSWRGIS
jgi:hypothetical protein